MTSLDILVNFSLLRKYHPEIEFLASSMQKRDEPINAVDQTIYIKDVHINEFESDPIEDFLTTYESVLSDDQYYSLLYLVFIITTDIERAIELTEDFEETYSTLNFINDYLRIKERGNSFSLEIKDGKSKAQLLSSTLISTTIDWLINKLKHPGFNPQLAYYLNEGEITRANISKILLAIKRRKNNPTNYTLGSGVNMLVNYLNDHTDLKSDSASMSNYQAKLIDNLFRIFSLINYNENRASETDYIRGLLRNFKRHYSL